jgi:hypothetical protein
MATTYYPQNPFKLCHELRRSKGVISAFDRDNVLFHSDLDRECFWSWTSDKRNFGGESGAYCVMDGEREPRYGLEH